MRMACFAEGSFPGPYARTWPASFGQTAVAKARGLVWGMDKRSNVREELKVERPTMKTKTEWTTARMWLLAILLVATMLGSVVASGQVLYGTLTGTVTDKSGAVIPKLTVSLTNQGTGEARTVVTSSVGEYRFGDVLPGTYTVAIARNGNFAAFSENSVVVDVNREVRIDISLSPASVNQTISVTDTAPTLQTETADVNHQITETQLAQ